MSKHEAKLQMIASWPGLRAHRARLAARYLRDMCEYYNHLANENPTGYLV